MSENSPLKAKVEARYSTIFLFVIMLFKDLWFEDANNRFNSLNRELNIGYWGILLTDWKSTWWPLNWTRKHSRRWLTELETKNKSLTIYMQKGEGCSKQNSSRNTWKRIWKFLQCFDWIIVCDATQFCVFDAMHNLFLGTAKKNFNFGLRMVNCHL